MDAERFDRIMQTLAAGASRRQVVGGLLGGLSGLLVRDGISARRGRRCAAGRERCGGRCVNLNTDKKHCGRCGNRCPAGERCLHGACFTQATCPVAQKACPNFVRCGADGGDCFCGTTTGGETVCFQDEDFCAAPRPCQNSGDCAEGRVCLDASDCCADHGLPDVPKTCVLPCRNLNIPEAMAAGGAKSAPGN